MTGEIRERRRVGDDGEWVVEKEYLLDGEPATAAAFLAAFPDHEIAAGGGPYVACAINDAHPLKSEALAVHPSQIEAAKARNKKHGVTVAYDRHGRPVFTDAGQRRALMKIEKVRDLNSFYGY